MQAAEVSENQTKFGEEVTINGHRISGMEDGPLPILQHHPIEKGRIMSTLIRGHVVLGLVAVLSYTMLTQDVIAQKNGRSVTERRQRPGKGFWANQRVSRNIRHARDYSRSIGRYATQAGDADPVVTKAESEILGIQLKGVVRDLGIVKDSNARDPDVVKQIQKLQAKVKKLSETQKVLHLECCKESPDGAVCDRMSSKITEMLDEIEKDHVNLMKATGDTVKDEEPAKKTLR